MPSTTAKSSIAPCSSARRINLSPRTIRRLTMEATSDKEILADLHRARAMELIQSTDLPMEKTAVRLGSGDVADSRHASKGRTGTTPRSCRIPGLA